MMISFYKEILENRQLCLCGAKATRDIDLGILNWHFDIFVDADYALA